MGRPILRDFSIMSFELQTVIRRKTAVCHDAPFRLHPLVHSLAPRMVSMVVAVAFMEPCCVAPYQFFRCHLPFSEHVYVQYLRGLTDSQKCPEKVGPRMTLPDSLLRLELALLFHLLRHSSLLMIPQQEAWWGLPGPVLSVLQLS